MRHLRLLLRLRLLLALRAFAGKPGRAAMAALAVLVMVPVAAAVTVGCFVLAREAPADQRVALATMVGGVAGLTLMMGPNAARPAGGMPLGRCLLWPIRTRTLLAAGLLGGLVSGPAVLAVPALGGFVAGLPAEAVWVVPARAALALLLVVFAVAFAGLLGLAGAWVLRSRRLREAVIVVMPLAFMAMWLVPQLVFGRGGQGFGRAAGLAAMAFPPAWIGRAIGELGGPVPDVWEAMLPVVAGALPLTALLLWADVRWFDRLARAETAGPARGGGATGWPSWLAVPRLLPAPAGEVMRREWTLAWREPGYRLYLIQFGLLALLPVVALFFLGAGSAAGPPLLAMLGLMLLGKEWRLSSNLLGLEGGGLRYTLALPIDRTMLVLGKVAAHGALFAGVNAAVLGLAGAFVGRPDSAAAVLLAVEAALLVQLGCGALVTVWLPHRMAARGRGALEGPEAVVEDWGTGCLRALAGWGTFALTLPPMGAVLGARLLGGPTRVVAGGATATALALGAVGFALSYGALFLWFGVRRAGAMLPAREERLVEIVEE